MNLIYNGTTTITMAFRVGILVGLCCYIKSDKDEGIPKNDHAIFCFPLLFSNLIFLAIG